MTTVSCVLAATFAAAAFIRPAEKPANANVAVLEKTFENRGEIARAVWKTTSLGVYQIYANGSEVGAADFLKPGYTECGKCRHVYEYDVTAALVRAKGAKNTLRARVSPGWWCDAMMRPHPSIKVPWQLGKEVGFRGELELEYADGGRETVETDLSWRGAYAGELVQAGIYEGEVRDARLKVGQLGAVVVNDEFKGELRPAQAKICKRHDLTLLPKTMTVLGAATGASSNAYGRASVLKELNGDSTLTLRKGETLVVDFGQNASAIPSFRVEGRAGTELEIRPVEMLNDMNGEKSRGNDGPAGTPYVAALRGAYAGIRYTLRQGRQAYRTELSFFGYRYLGVTATATVNLGGFRSIPVTSVTKRMERGEITTGSADINRLISNVRWGFYSNYLSIPTDCPQRDERLGWTADTQVFVESAEYLADVKPFLAKYLADLTDAQYADGLYQCFVPNCRHLFRHGASSGWTDAGVMIPYRLWKRYGDLDIVRRQWASMNRYMDFLVSTNTPYTINHGDWLAYEHRDPKSKSQTQQLPGIATMLSKYYIVWIDRMMKEMAGALGRTDDEKRYAERERRDTEIFRRDCLGADGTLIDRFKGQCNDLYVLKLGLCGNEAAREATKRHLIADIRAHGNRLQTGFLGTAILMPTLTFDADAPEVAYDLLFQRGNPSWLYSIDQGATTIWERWNGYTVEDGFGPKIMNSFNHYAYGCVLEWLYAAAAGIRQDDATPGWKHFILRPYVDRRLGFVKAKYVSPAGPIESEWRYAEDGSLSWRIRIPSGTTASVWKPGEKSAVEMQPGTYEFKGLKK